MTAFSVVYRGRRKGIHRSGDIQRLHASSVANLFGPAGYVSADDGEAIEHSQRGLAQDPQFVAVCELGGAGVADSDHMVTETLIRGMYRYWREVMEL